MKEVEKLVAEIRGIDTLINITLFLSSPGLWLQVGFWGTMLPGLYFYYLVSRYSLYSQDICGRLFCWIMIVPCITLVVAYCFAEEYLQKVALPLTIVIFRLRPVLPELVRKYQKIANYLRVYAGTPDDIAASDRYHEKIKEIEKALNLLNKTTHL